MVSYITTPGGSLTYLDGRVEIPSGVAAKKEKTQNRSSESEGLFGEDGRGFGVSSFGDA